MKAGNISTKVAAVHCREYARDSVKNSVLEAIRLLGGISRFLGPGSRVLVKPNLCVAEPPEACVNTHPEIIRAVVELCLDAGADVLIGDNPIGDADRSRLKHIWERSGVAAALKGIHCRRSFLDQSMVIMNCSIAGKDYAYYISQDVLEMDLIINIPKFKSHVLTTFTGAIKNLYGVLPGNSKKKLHSQLPVVEDFAILLVDIYRKVKPGLHIMDAVTGIEGDGPGVRGTRRDIGLIMASTDGLALDRIGAGLMGIDSENIATNRIGAAQGIGVMDPAQIEITGVPLEHYIMKDFRKPSTYRYTPDVTRRIFNLSRAYVRIYPQKCIACNLCAPNCPAGAIIINDGTAVIDQKTCIACLVCHEICPEGAVYTERSTFYKQLKRLRKEKGKAFESER